MKGATRKNRVGVVLLVAVSFFVLVITAQAGSIDAGEGEASGMAAEPAVTGTVIYISSNSDGNVGDFPFTDDDILGFSPSTDAWAMFFDGSDVGLNQSEFQDVDAFDILDDGSVLISTGSQTTLPGVGTIDDSDIVQFSPTSMGRKTRGTYSLYFDGSDVGLVKAADDIDALTLLANGDLVLSTVGRSAAAGFDSEDEDLLRFRPKSLGEETTGTWSLYFDGSDVGFGDLAGGDVWGVSVDHNSGTIYLTTANNFDATGITGGGADIIECQPTSLGGNTKCTFQLTLDGSLNGIGGELVDGIAVHIPYISSGSGSAETPAAPTKTPKAPTTTPAAPTTTPAAPTTTPAAPPSTPVPGSNREFFLSPTGSDSSSGTTPGEAWATFDYAQTVLEAGDTLTLLDGIYYQRLYISKTGQPGNPITIRAKNDGKAIIDGQFERYPIQTKAGDKVNYYVEIEGVVARNSVRHVVHLGGSHVTLRRVSAYNAHTDENAQVIAISGNHNLVEDCVASGTGRKMIAVFDGEYNTIRRCVADWREWDGRNWCGSEYPWGEGIEFYGASNNIIENSIAYGHTPRAGVSVLAQGPQKANNNKVLGTMSVLSGMKEDGTEMLWGPDPNNPPITQLQPLFRPGPTQCKVLQIFDQYPSMLAGIRVGGSGTLHNNLLQDVLAWGSARYGLSFHRAGTETSFSNNSVNRATVYNNGLTNITRWGGVGAGAAQEELVEFASIENSHIEDIWMGGSSFVTQEGEGARLVNRYVDGELTNEPLWPWPMEERIQNELGYSVTKIMADIIPGLP